MKRTVMAPELPAPKSPLAHAVVANGFVFVSGQAPVDPATRSFPEGIEAQTRQCLANVETVLRAAGSSLDKVVKVSAFLSDVAFFPQFNAVYREVFGTDVPARTTVGASLSGFLVEIDCIAHL